MFPGQICYLCIRFVHCVADPWGMAMAKGALFVGWGR